MLSGTQVPGMTHCSALTIADKLLFAANDRQLVIFDLTNPAVPQKCAELEVMGARQIVSDGKYLYLSARQWGVQVFDVSQPAAPKQVAWIDSTEMATGLDLSGNLLCVTNRVYGIELFDVSNPLLPRRLSLLRIDGIAAQSVFCYDGKIAIGDWRSGQFVVADISNPYHPQLIGSAALDGYGDGVWVCRGYGYASTGHHAKHGPKESRYGNGHGLEIFDLTDPRRPRRTGGVKFPRFHELNNDFWSVRADGETAYVTDTHNGFFLVDVADPANPGLLGRFVLPNRKRFSQIQNKEVVDPDCATGLAVGDGVVYVAGQKSGIFVLPVGKRARPLERNKTARILQHSPEKLPNGVIRHPVPGIVRRLAIRGDELFAACSADGVRRFRIVGEGALKEIPAQLGGIVYDVAVRGDILLAARGLSLESYRIEPDRLVRLGEIAGTFSRPFQVIHLFGKTAICSGGTRTVTAVDVSDPAQLRFAGRNDGPSLLYSDVIPERAVDGVFPVHWPGREIRFLSVKDGSLRLLPFAAPKQNLDQLSGITAVGTKFIAPFQQGLLVLDPHDGSAVEKKTSGAAYPSGIPSWSGDGAVAFSDRRSGKVTVFDCRDLDNIHPIEKRSYDLSSGVPDRAVFYRGRMFIPCWNLGIIEEFGHSDAGN